MFFLYRGVCEERYQELKGILSPKKSGDEFASEACFRDECGPGWGSGIVFGKSDINAVVLHQWQQAAIPTSGISSTPHFERARFYALSAGKSHKGYVFKLSIHQLHQDNVTIYRVNELVPCPAVPEDDEHVLVASNFSNIPKSSIIAVEEVYN
ncbi:hypothetical protein Rhein_0708 [Rheinheimera sp. A13L]|uniref:hypothetical protein n=1 Tax=Rheinheimera sp. A13L TaxID=506534 RepID=UPI00021252B2|nr:hypothetical protein [Rheinheimera sp. A13L]EGM79090.1 hypothetical protein Rhein_0708 [Rheinheimera sp. A13L]